MISTIVFAGASKRDMPMLEKAGADAIMVSFEKLKGDKPLQRMMKEGLPWKPKTYLDSGVFTFMRKAGVVTQGPGRGGFPAWEEFLKLASAYVEYLKRDYEAWDHIIELDVDDVYGIEPADMLRNKLREIVGDRLLPVWHAARGPEGWTQMVRDFSYICLSPSKTAGGKSTKNTALFRSMVREAHANGTEVHLLGASTIEWFDSYEVDTMDSSGWSAGVRWGELKVNRGKITLPKFESKTRRPLIHSHLLQLEELAVGWGYTLEQIRDDYLIRIEVGIRLLLLRQEEIRNARVATATA